MTNKDIKFRVVPCPRCRKSTRYDPSNEFRPFCSALCKNEDIVDWAEGKYAIPLAPNEDDEQMEIPDDD